MQDGFLDRFQSAQPFPSVIVRARAVESNETAGAVMMASVEGEITAPERRSCKQLGGRWSATGLPGLLRRLGSAIAVPGGGLLPVDGLSLPSGRGGSCVGVRGAGGTGGGGA